MHGTGKIQPLSFQVDPLSEGDHTPMGGWTSAWKHKGGGLHALKHYSIQADYPDKETQVDIKTVWQLPCGLRIKHCLITRISGTAGWDGTSYEYIALPEGTQLLGCRLALWEWHETRPVLVSDRANVKVEAFEAMYAKAAAWGKE